MVEPGDVLNKMTYALTNRFTDGLVERRIMARRHVVAFLPSWHPLYASRPKHFFRDEGPMPETINHSFGRPRGFEHLSSSEFFELVVSASARSRSWYWWSGEERGAARARRRGVLAQKTTDRPQSRERASLNPRVAPKASGSRIEALLRKRRFGTRTCRRVRRSLPVS